MPNDVAHKEPTMTRFLLTLSLLMTTASATHARLEIGDIQSTHGPLLPERKVLEYSPEDMIFFRFLANGVKVDPAGKVDVETVVTLHDANGKELTKHAIPSKARLSLGGDAFAGFAYLTLNEQYVSGAYTFKATVIDHLGSEKASFQREVRIRPSEFAIVRPRFSYDAEGRAPAPVGGLVSQTLHFRIEAYGFDRGQERVHLVSSVQVLDAKGKELLPAPLETVLKSEDAKLVKATTVGHFSGSLGLHRPGEFTLRITVEDKIAQKSTKLELPLRVVAP